MTTTDTPDWNVRAADTALVLERVDGALVTSADADAVYEQVNGFPRPVDPSDPEDVPPGLSPGRCENTEDHPAHRAQWQTDEGVIQFWCMGGPVADPPAADQGGAEA